jgi:hypothetical protein
MCIYGQFINAIKQKVDLESKHTREKKKRSEVMEKSRDNWAVNLCSLYDST